jgi:hypothetical protein
MPATITDFQPLIDAEWAEENIGKDFESGLSVSGMNNEIFVEIADSGEKYSIHQLASDLAPLKNDECGAFKKEVRCNEGWISGPSFKYKIKGYNISYTLSKPFESPMVIDFSKELVGVIEYLQKGTKKSIFKDGVVKHNDLPKKR